MQKISLKIFISVLIAGIIGIVGELTLKYSIDMLLLNYTEIINEHITNRNYINDINRLLYEHQSVVANYILTSNNEIKKNLEAKEVKIRKELKELFSLFGSRMQGNKREQIYHKAYSNYYSYLNDAAVAMDFSRSGDNEMAEYYTISVMNVFIEEINIHFSDLNKLIADEEAEAAEKMNYYMEFSKISETVSITLIVLAIVICLIYCMNLTNNLDNYKEDLEKQIIAKNAAIRERNEKMLSLQNNIIIGMANLIESRDGDTGEHVKRTSVYVAMLAKKAKEKGIYDNVLTDEYVELLTKAAPMHDIGKISVPDRILQKPGKLTDEEFESIKSHAPEGGRIIKEVLGNLEDKKYVDIASDVAHYHHEKWNGKGYPDGLSGEDIPLCARIMAVADVFDALVSKRCYKRAMEFNEAFKIIEESSGSHFDPVLAGLFLELKDEIKKFLGSGA